MKNTTIGSDVRRLADTWRDVKQTELAAREGSDGALRAMKQEDLVHLAYQALELLADIDATHSLLLTCCDEHVDGSGSEYAGWVIAQSDGETMRAGSTNGARRSAATCTGRIDTIPRHTVATS